jgi:3-hydroxyisobutyrate dehydrogenase
MRIGVAGLGKMGSAIALRLIEVGHELTVWNRSAGKAAPLLAAGAAEAASPAALVGSVEIVLTMLFDAAARDAVYRGPDGLLEGPAAGRLFIDMSTVTPDDARALAGPVRQAGAAFVECPVGGTTAPARQGTLLGLAGGEPADVARARPVLEQLCRRLEHVGPVGAGAAMKLAINLPLVVFWQAFGEANALIHGLGHDPDWLVGLFAETAGGPNILRARAPAIAAALGGGDPGPATFDIASVCKDLELMQQHAASLGFDLPVAARTLSVFQTAREANWGPRDCTLLPTLWSQKG